MAPLCGWIQLVSAPPFSLNFSTHVHTESCHRIICSIAALEALRHPTRDEILTNFYASLRNPHCFAVIS